jgi:hypothetical protein
MDQPIIQVTLQLLQYAWLTSSLRESPVARIEKPTVRTAAVALPPLIPFFCLIRFTSTPPVTPQCGHFTRGEFPALPL